jgi:hypothetical protein
VRCAAVLQDHRTLDRTLICPAIPFFFKIYPPFIRRRAMKYFNEIGMNFVSELFLEVN